MLGIQERLAVRDRERAGMSVAIACVALASAACGGGGSTSPDAGGIASVRVTPTSMEMQVGETDQLTATAFNATGQPVTATFTWISSQSSVATVTGNGSIVALQAGQAQIRATAGAVTGQSVVTVTQPLPPDAPTGMVAFGVSDGEIRVFWTDRSDNETGFQVERELLGAPAELPEGEGDTLDESTSDEGTSLEFTVVAMTGPDENTYQDTDVLPNSLYRYRVSACNEQGCTPGAVGVEATTYETLVLVTGTVPGGRLGDAYQEALIATGGDGTFIWSLIDGAIPNGITFTGGGVLEGTPLAEGTFTFATKVVSGGQEATQSFSLVIAAGFFLDPADPEVGRVGLAYDRPLALFGGVPPFAWSVTAGALPGGITLDPADGSLEGTPTTLEVADFTIRAQDFEGSTADRDLSMEICEPPVIFGIGDTRTIELPDRCGIVIDGGVGTYRAVLTARFPHNGPSEVPAGFTLATSAGQPGVDFPVAPAISIQRDLPFDDGLDPEIRALAEATERLHMQLREEEYRSNFTRPGATPPLGPPLEALGLPAPQAVDPPTTRMFYINEPGVGRSQRFATLRGFNASVEYYEDDGVLVEGTRATDQQVQDLIDYYHTYGTPIINDAFGGLGPPGTTQNFRADGGGPVLTVPTDDIDQNGRFIVLQIRPTLMPSGAAAYVSSCDRRARPENLNAGGTCNGSNQAEITYISRPGSAFYLGTTVHEAKHVSSHGYAVFAGRGFNTSFIEEGTAEIAKEKSSRDASGFADGQELEYDDLWPRTNATYGMTVVTGRSRSFLSASPYSAVIGNPSPNPNGSTFYGAGWLFHRFLADNYAAGNEDAFFLALNTVDDDIDRIEQVVGKSFEELMTEFVSAISVEGSPLAKAAAQRSFLSYDHADIASQFGGTWPYPQAILGFGTASIQIPTTFYTAPNFFELSSTGGMPMRIDALTAGGLPVDASHAGVLVITRIG